MPTDRVFAPDFSHEPYWWEHARPEPTRTDGPELPDETDVAVIGSGYAGLCCALELARSGLDVTVLDAGDIGSGASSRAAGFVSGRTGVSKQIDLTAAVGETRAVAILEEADEAYDHLQNVIATENIDCDFKPCGRFVGAHTPQAFDKISTKAAEYNFDGQNRVEMVSRADQCRYVNSSYFHGGMMIHDAGTLHPAKYHAGLVELCQAAGVRLIGQTRMTEVADHVQGGRRAVTTEHGVIHARDVMLGTGGYTDGALPWHQRRVIPISSTLMASEELEPERVAALLPAGCPVIDTKRVIGLVRPSPDGRRIMFGGRARFTPVGAEESVRILHAQMREVFPELSDVRMTHAWSGLMGFTFDFLPKVGVQDGVHHALACNGGSGIVMMSWLGRKAAWNILGGANRGSAFEGLPFPTQPFYAGTPWFMPVIGTWYRARDWWDMRGVRVARSADGIH